MRSGSPRTAMKLGVFTPVYGSLDVKE